MSGEDKDPRSLAEEIIERGISPWKTAGWRNLQIIRAGMIFGWMVVGVYLWLITYARLSTTLVAIDPRTPSLAVLLIAYLYLILIWQILLYFANRIDKWLLARLDVPSDLDLFFASSFKLSAMVLDGKATFNDILAESELFRANTRPFLKRTRVGRLLKRDLGELVRKPYALRRALTVSEERSDFAQALKELAISTYSSRSSQSSMDRINAIAVDQGQDKRIYSAVAASLSRILSMDAVKNLIRIAVLILTLIFGPGFLGSR